MLHPHMTCWLEAEQSPCIENQDLCKGGGGFYSLAVVLQGKEWVARWVDQTLVLSGKVQFLTELSWSLSDFVWIILVLAIAFVKVSYPHY